MILNYSGLSPTRDELWLEASKDERDAERAAFMQEVAFAHATWIVARDEFARICRYHLLDIPTEIEEAHGLLCDASANIQDAILRQYE